MFNLLKIFKRRERANPFNRGWGSRESAVIMIKEWIRVNNVRYEQLCNASGVSFDQLKRFLANRSVWNSTVQKIWDGARKIHDILTSLR